MPQNTSKAVELYRKAAEQGYSKAQYDLAWMYSSGKGTTQDSKKAFNWYKKAAEQGHDSAQYELGAMYAFGRGVTKDLSKTKYWIKKAYKNPNISSKTLKLVKKIWSDFELWKY